MKAFPKDGIFDSTYGSDGWRSSDQDGMDLRDYFAAKAMQAMVNNSFVSDSGRFGINAALSDLTELAYDVADAMLKSRNLKSEAMQSS